eukprot:CAMPEP_0181176324 /NCGR_PEP_ID=MMETSP1096-20121128/4567_1 /TAXON_ID=156174 ORGANISM="Chrysochromulina ericina, Strain CCMP281" /NCGR_SAMPLE_ID=MMETSP1096 /ASSEMBLY_ACC=CAM_ASM_000453 /LENGTH=66 /DNA_ID=CAMNT_0023264401 /DNA_START=452 /DNA_END=649 /DNA_ORIENTATION=-
MTGTGTASFGASPVLSSTASWLGFQVGFANARRLHLVTWEGSPPSTISVASTPCAHPSSVTTRACP